MWWCNILGDNEGSISDILRIDNITTGCFLLTSNTNVLKREYPEPILTVKVTEWRKFIDYFGLSIETNPSSVGKKNVYFFHIGSMSISSSGQLHISRHRLEKYFNLEPPKIHLYQLTKLLAAEIAPHTPSALR